MLSDTKKTMLFSLAAALMFSYLAVDAHFTTLENEEEYNTLITSKKPFVLQFSAPWCGACEQVKKPVEEVAAEPEFDTITIMRINSDTFRNLASAHAIRGIPTFIFFNNGQKINTMVGIPQGQQNPKENFRNALRQYLLKSKAATTLNDLSNNAKTENANNQTQASPESPSILDSIKNTVAALVTYLSSLINSLMQTITGKNPRT